MSNSLPIAFAVYPLLLSGVALAWLSSLRYRNWLNWAVWVLACGNIIAFAFLAGSWAFTSYYLRYILLGLFAVVVVFSYTRVQRSLTDTAPCHRRISIPSVLVLVLFLVLNSLAITSYYPSEKTLEITFPFGSGTYYVLQGGASIVTNPFHGLGGSMLAIDIVKLNAFGNRADGIAPRALSAYEIFGETLYSPCQGRIVNIRDGLPDNPPGNPDLEYPEGNYIVLKCAEADIVLAHLKQNSITVTPEKGVTLGQPLAEIGNSGNTLEPHLHIGASKDGEEMGLSFDGQWLSVNSIINRE